MNDIEIWLDRLSSLYKSQMRQAVNSEGMKLVHLEILRYLSMCNKYSNTAQAMTEYLGQTKGSISQSLKFLVGKGYIERKSSVDDKRVVKLYLTQFGSETLERMTELLMPDLEESTDTVSSIKSLLMQWQEKNHYEGFGQCKTCRYNTKEGNDEFICGLTNESLTIDDINRICREHQFNHE